MEKKKDQGPTLTVVGAGGAGSNAVNNMIRSGLEGVNFVVCNTDAQALQQSLADVKIQLGPEITQGLGAGSRPDVGKASAEESIDEVMSHLKGAHMIFITAGMGGGTGTGGAPVIAKAAREAGILTVGVVTKPFHFEGSHRMQSAEAGIEAMNQCVDTLLVIPNQNLFRLATEGTTFADAFAMADDVLYSGVRTFTDLMIKHGLINLDFADICAVMREMMGKAMMGTGQAMGERRAIDAAEQAISCPLLDSDITMKGARAVLINITGGPDMTLFEVDEAANRIREEVDPSANIIFGATFDQSLNGELRVAVVATGIDAEDATQSSAKEGNFKVTPRSVFQLDGKKAKKPEQTAEESEGLFADKQAQAAPESAADAWSETPGDVPSKDLLGRKHNVFAEEAYNMAQEETSTSLFEAPQEEAVEGLWGRQPKEAPQPKQPTKRRSFNLLEKLGMRRAAATEEKPSEPAAPVAAPQPPSDKVAPLKKAPLKPVEQEVPQVNPVPAEEDTEVPAFMRSGNKR